MEVENGRWMANFLQTGNVHWFSQVIFHFHDYFSECKGLQQILQHNGAFRDNPASSIDADINRS